MDNLILDPATQYAAGGVVVAAVITFLLVQPTRLVKWLQKKNYQYEVTFALYMLTPTEKFIFNSVLFLTLSLLAMASFVYLPNHLAMISRRAYYYFAGDATLAEVASHAAAAAGSTATKAADAVREAATTLIETAQQAAASAAGAEA